MTIRTETRKNERTAADRARLKAIRDSIQKTKPNLDALRAKGETIVPLGTYLAVQELLADFRSCRRKQKLTLEQVAKKAGMDVAALSRLETGKQPNPTVDSLFRVAFALGRTIDFRFGRADSPKKTQRRKRAPV